MLTLLQKECYLRSTALFLRNGGTVSIRTITDALSWYALQV